MTAPNPADVELVAAATEAHHIVFDRTDAMGNSPCVCGEWWDAAGDNPGWDQHMAEVGLAALAGAGRLLPSNADIRTAVQFGVRFTRPDGSSWVSECPQGVAEDRAAFYAKRRAAGPDPIESAEVVHRSGGSWVGPWLPVPTTPPVPSPEETLR